MDSLAALPIIFRGSERLFIIAAAALCVILGYKLFKILPSQNQSEGKFTLGDLSVTLTKVGPGVFFSLFGVFVLYQSAQISLNMELTTSSEKNKSATEIKNSGQSLSINWMASTDSENEVWKSRAMGHIKLLNCLANKSEGSDLELRRIEDAIHAAKVSIIADIWMSKWGGTDEFVQLNMGSIEEDSPIGKLYFACEEGC